MDPKSYSELIQRILTEHARHKPSYGDIEVETIFDLQHDRYQIVHMGWHHQRRVHQCLMHIDIRNHKIWILHNTIEHELDTELLDEGVPKTDIVLGFCPPELRSFSDFAVQ